MFHTVLNWIFLPAARMSSSFFNWLQSSWTPPGLDPGSTGVTTFYETINIEETKKRCFYDSNISKKRSYCTT